MMDITIPYYEDKTRVSNSAIGWFLKKGPLYFYKMMTGEIEGEKSAAMDRGTMIHSYILTPEEFQKTYVVWDKSRPSSPQQEKFCQELAETVEIEPDKAILSAYKAAYSTAGKTDDKMLSEGLKIASTLKNYIDFLKERSGKIMISPWDYQMLKKIKHNIENHKKARELVCEPTAITDIIKVEENGTLVEGIIYEVHHEFHINWEYTITPLYKEDPRGFSFIKDRHIVSKVQCKSLLDSLTLDFAGKRAIILDLKTTQKLWNFEESVDTYDYCRQLMFYKQAVMWYLESERDENPEEWEFEYYIVGIDTTGDYDIRVFKLEEFMLQSRANVIEDVLKEIDWHNANNEWEHSRAYYEGNGSEQLDL